MFKAYAATKPKGHLAPLEFDPGPLGAEEVEIKVNTCGICHSDLSMLDNEWGMTTYPFVPGHEVSGIVHAVGERVDHLKAGQKVGLGWYSRSCMQCRQCLSGDHNLCAQAQGTIVGRYGGFADYVRCHRAWALPIPEELDETKAGPLFCGGITVFNPMVQFDLRPTQRVGVIGIGGLGHMAIQFLDAWGCDVTAFSSSSDKEEEARSLGAHHFVNSRDPRQLEAIAGKLDFILSTVNVGMDWGSYLSALGPRGRLHFVGAVLEPLSIPVFGLLVQQKSISATPLGSPVTTAQMLDFCARHSIKPITETFPLSRVNDAIEHLRAGKARYRIILDMNA